MRCGGDASPERLRPPQHFQERLTQVGGVNRYGEPMFKLAWAQTETQRQGGEWEGDGDWFRGYRDIYVGDGLPHWMLMQWADAGKHPQMLHMPAEGPKQWYMANQCPKTGLSLLGEYPHHGKYYPVLQLVSKQFFQGQMFINAFPLSTEIVEMMVPIIKASMEISIQAKMMALKEEKEADEKKRSDAFEDAYRSIRRNPNLASTAWLEDKQRKIESAWNASLVTMMHRNRRFTANRRVTVNG